MSTSEPEPIDPNELPLAQLGRPYDDHDDEVDGGTAVDGHGGRPTHLRAIVIGAALVVVVGLVLGIVVFNRSAAPLGRGLGTAKAAAIAYVHALNRGDERAAADVACDPFVDDARAAAASGRDGGISFVLGTVRQPTDTDGVATIVQRFTLPGGASRSHPAGVSLQRSAGRWLVCGHAG